MSSGFRLCEIGFVRCCNGLSSESDDVYSHVSFHRVLHVTPAALCVQYLIWHLTHRFNCTSLCEVCSVLKNLPWLIPSLNISEMIVLGINHPEMDTLSRGPKAGAEKEIEQKNNKRIQCMILYVVITEDWEGSLAAFKNMLFWLVWYYQPIAGTDVS